MDLKTLRSELAFLVNFTEGAADQDFVTARLNKALNRAYTKEVASAKLVATRKFFLANESHTWPASTLRFSLPKSLRGKALVDWQDVTDGEPGVRLDGISWFDRDTLQWDGEDGPGSARTIRFFYEAVAEELIANEQEPRLIPPEYHMLIVWTAACFLRGIGDDVVPRDWKIEREELRLDYQKWVARGRPLTDTPRVRDSRDGGFGATTQNVAGFGSPGDGLDPP